MSIDEKTSNQPLDKVLESAHPYADSQDTTTVYSFPGAIKLIIKFDVQSRSENGCDYVRFLEPDTQQILHPEISFFSGRDGSQNWPGCEVSMNSYSLNLI
jgi:hypothetical protein